MSEKKNLAFGKSNYVWFLSGLFVLVLGLIIMASDSETFGFGFLGLTLGPIVLLSGFILQFFTIFRKGK